MSNNQNQTDGVNNSNSTELQIFKFKENEIRVHVTEQGNPEFCALDITNLLGYSNGRDAITKLCDSKGVAKHDTLTQGGSQSLTYINEPNLYRLVFKSTKPEADQFVSWVSEEVLPSIRKYGMYANQFTMEKLIANPDLLIGIASELKKEKKLREQAEYDKKKLEERNKDYVRVINVQDEVLHKQAVKVEYHDKVLKSKSLIVTTVIAKELGMSAVALNRKLKQLNVIYTVNDSYALYAKYQNLGYAGYKTFHFTDENGTDRTKRELYWTETGRQFIIHLLRPEMKLEPIN